LAKTNESNTSLHRARLQALAVPILYAAFGCLWILVSDLALEALHLAPHVTTRIAMIKGWIFVAGSTLLISVVMRAAWATLEGAYARIQEELVERKKAQEESVRLAAELELRVQDRTRHLQEALSELAFFSDSVSHDLRAPLHIMTGYVSALEESQGVAMDEEGRQYLSRLKISARKMERMIRGLLELSRHGRESLNIEVFDAGLHGKLVDEIWMEVCQNPAGRSVRFERGAFPTVRCDPRLVEHVWRNLLSNAAKYSRVREIAEIRVEFRDGWFRVRDNGVGFEPAQATRMFRPFERLHRVEEFEGDGIGLALVSRILERHDGAIEADSKPGEGSEFRFRLPMA